MLFKMDIWANLKTIVNIPKKKDFNYYISLNWLFALRCIMQGYGIWNNWEKEEGSTKEIGGRVHKEGFEMIWLEKTECRQLKQMVRVN